MTIEVTLPGGQVATFPDGTSDATIQAAVSSHLNGMEHSRPGKEATRTDQSTGPIGLEDVGRSLLAGFGKATSLFPRALSYAPTVPPWDQETFRKAADRNQQFYQEVADKGHMRGIPATFVEGVGGSLLAGPSSAPIRGAIAGGIGNIGAEAGGEIGGMPGALIGGTLAGGLIGGIIAPRQNRADSALRRATEGMSYDDFAAAQKLIEQYKGTGAKTGTLADFLPGNNRLLSLAIETRNSRGGERLSSQVANREQDLANLNQTIINRSGIPGVPAEVTNRAQAAAEAVLAQRRGLRSSQYQRDMAGALQLDPTQVETFRQLLLKQAGAAQSSVEKDAYLAAADALTSANKGMEVKSTVVPSAPIGSKGFRTAATTTQEEVPVSVPKTDVSAIAKDLKQMQERANPLTATGGQSLDRHTVGQRYQEVQNFLKATSPNYQRAEANYSDYSRNVIDPLVGGPIGDLSGRNPRALADPSASVLGNITKDQTPQSIPGIMGTLQEGESQLPSQLLPQIARAIVAQKLQKGPLNASQALRGTPGSPEEGNLRALLEGANMNSQPLIDALDVSHSMQNFRNLPTSTGEVPMQTVGLRALTAADRFLGTKMQEKYYKQIAELLSSPDQTSLRKLQEVAMFDPSVRKQLMLKGAMTSIVEGNTP